MPHKIFTSYSHLDERFKHELDKHLTPLLLQGKIETWNDRNIRAGAPLYEEIKDNIRAADIILMLISADYISSRSCQEEMSVALLRSQSREAIAIPVIVRACDWTGLPIGKLLSANKDGLPINSAKDFDVAWCDVVIAIRQILNDWDALNAADNPTASMSTPAEVSNAFTDELVISSDNSGDGRDQWVYRKESNDGEWGAVKSIIEETLNAAAENDVDNRISLEARRWGDKIIIDFTSAKYRNSRRLFIADIGGNVGYPGYQLVVYPRDDKVEIGPERVRWMRKANGERVLKRLGAGGDKEFTASGYAENLWREMKRLS